MQAAAALAPRDRPLVIVAGAGSGKTATLVARIAHIVDAKWATASQVLAVTHTTKAAAELKERLAQAGVSGVSCHTVHAAAWKVVRENFQAAGFSRVPQLVSNTFPLVRTALDHVTSSRSDAALVADVTTEIEWARSFGISFSQYANAIVQRKRTPPADVKLIVATWEAFEQLKVAQGCIDFADVLSAATRVLANDVCAQTIRDCWRAVVVDEFQDTDRSQYEFLSAVRGGRPLYSVVGDRRQTIYSFKGADSELLFEAVNDSEATVVQLSTSYRCSRQILSWANAAIGTKYGAALEGVSDGPTPKLEVAANEEEEVDAVVAGLNQWRRQGVQFSDMAILFRFNSAAARFEAALSRAQIPYHVTGSQPFFERAEVLGVLSPFGKVARSMPETNGALELLRAANSTGWDEHHSPSGQGVSRGRWESVLALVDMVRSTPGLSSGELLQSLLSGARGGGGAGVTLATIHAAKGLEWSAVCVVGCAEGQLPSVYATTPTEIEEERRLFYVALTRAKTHLLLTYPLKRGKGSAVKASRYLALLPGAANRTVVRGVRKQQSTPASALVPLSGLSCDKCKGRLSGLAARKAHRCSPGCLEGQLAARWAVAEVWRTATNPKLSERALFHLVVTGETGTLWPATIEQPQLPKLL